MTIDAERLRAIEQTRDFLKSIGEPGRVTKGELRKKAYWLLKHYPEPHWVERVKELIGPEELR